jgi:hypothetical protein
MRALCVGSAMIDIIVLVVKIGRDANDDKIINRLAAEHVDDAAVFRRCFLPDTKVGQLPA